MRWPGAGSAGEPLGPAPDGAEEPPLGIAADPRLFNLGEQVLLQIVMGGLFVTLAALS